MHQLVNLVAHIANKIGQILALKRHAEDAEGGWVLGVGCWVLGGGCWVLGGGGCWKRELFADVIDDLWRSCCREC